MDPVIFLEKVRRPALRGLVRERLDRRAASLAGVGADPVSLALVLGPPGSGKTTLLSHIAEAAGDAAAWYRVGTEDDDEIALTRHLGHTLGAALHEPAVIEAAAAGRIADLVRVLDGPTIGPGQLIIDDLHEIAGTPAERALESFLSLRPRKIRITLGSRRPPRINTSRMLVSGELTQLDGEDLRFRSWEVEQLFRAVYEAPLSPEAAAALTRRTGGWAAGLQLFHLATAQLSRAERERAVDELSGRSRLIRSYLARNVLEGLDPGRRRFLLLTSTLGVLTGDLCDDLLDTSGSASVLSELEREQFFTTSTDAGLTYHYHQVLQTHLEVLLVDELGGRAARELYSRSGSLLGAGRPARRRDPGPRPGRGLGIGGPAAETRHRAGQRRRGPVGHALAARRADRRSRAGAGRGAPAGPARPDRRVGRRLPAGGGPAGRSGVPPALHGGTQHGGHLAAAGADPADARRPTRPMPTRPCCGCRWSSARSRVRSATPTSHARPLVRGLALLLAGDLAAASRELRGADPSSRPAAAAWEPLAERLAARLIDLMIEPDEVVAGQVEEIMLSADVQGWPWLSRIARGLQAAMLLAAAPAPWRISAAAELLDDLERGGDRWTVCLTSLAIGAVYARIDQPDLATRTLRRTEEVAAALGAPVLGSVGERAAHRRGRPPGCAGGGTGGGQRAARGGRARSEPRGRGGRADPSGSTSPNPAPCRPSGSTGRGLQRGVRGCRCAVWAGSRWPWRAPSCRGGSSGRGSGRC